MSTFLLIVQAHGVNDIKQAVVIGVGQIDIRPIDVGRISGQDINDLH
jgi:hypothetical protein